MLRWLWRLTPPLVAVVVLGLATTVRANTISVSFVSHIGNVFTYQADLSPQGALQNGDGFTIFDFALPTGGNAFGSLLSPFWQFVITPGVGSPVPGVGALGAILSPGGDNPLVDNVSFVWQGGALPGNLVTSIDLGQFSITTNAPSTAFDYAISKDSGSDLANAFGPVPVAAVVPLPQTANMGLALLACLGGIGAWRRMKGTQEVA